MYIPVQKSKTTVQWEHTGRVVALKLQSYFLALNPLVRNFHILYCTVFVVVMFAANIFLLW